MTAVFFSVKALSYTYENTGQQVLKHLDLSLAQGEILAIVGASGVGKTTLFHLVAGLLPLQEGEILLENQPLELGKVSYMLQKDLLLPHKTVLENVALPQILKGVLPQEAYAQAEEQLALFSLQSVKTAYPHQLSGGMRQRVALLRTYLCGQDFILLDEPFSALDALTKREMQLFYQKIHRQLGLTALLITHDIDEALLLANQICVLAGKPGEVVFSKKLEFPKNEAQATLERLDVKKEILQAMGL